MVASCIRHVSFLSISCTIACTQLEYQYDAPLSTAIAQEISHAIEQLVEQKKMAEITTTIPAQFPCVAAVTIEHLPEQKAKIHIRSVQPVVRITIASTAYIIDTHGKSISPAHFTQDTIATLPSAHALRDALIQPWNPHLTTAITYLNTACPQGQIEIDNLHAIRVKPSPEQNSTIMSDAYQLPSAVQLALCARQQEEHGNQSATHLKKCKQVMFDTRFKEQIIQRCIFAGAPNSGVARIIADGVTIGGTGHGSHTT